MYKGFLAIIFALALILRTVSLSSYAQGFTPDEASFGYDAYSLLKTGKDQWGRVLPLVLESFGDFKPPLLAYISIPFVGILGLNETAVRLPNALLGSLAVVVVYLLVKEIFRSEKRKEEIAIVASFMLSISSWHVMMSRGAFEANLTTFLMPLGVLLFLKGLTSPKFLMASSLVFGLNLFSYHSARFVTPLIFACVIVLWRKELLKLAPRYIVSFVGVFVAFSFLVLHTFTQGAGARAADISVFAGAMEEAASPRLELINSGTPELIAKVIHNKFSVAAIRFVGNYSQYYSLKFLFSDGPNEATYGMVPGVGVLYLIETVSLMGFVYWFFRNPRSKGGRLLVFWLIVSPVPAALAQGVGFSANRALIMIPSITVVSAIGMVVVCHKFSEKLKIDKRLVYGLPIFLIFFQALWVFTKYTSSSRVLSESMLYGRIGVIREASHMSAESGVEDIVVSRSLSEPHIYVAFHHKWDPKDYQRNSREWGVYRDKNLRFLDQLDPYSLGNYTFTSIEGKEAEDLRGHILVGKPDEFSQDISPSQIVYYPNNEAALYIINE